LNSHPQEKQDTIKPFLANTEVCFHSIGSWLMSNFHKLGFVAFSLH